MKKHGLLFGLAFGLLILGGFLAHRTQTGGGTIRIEDVRFPGPDGIIQNARLYVPQGVTEQNPGPGIVAIHGYINTHETQAGFAIEFARRGFVVLAVDQTGHGYSDPPSGANGFGGPPALTFLRTLPFVDTDNIGLEGHSMGGWAVLSAAAAIPDGYKAIVLEGSSVGAGREGQRAGAGLKNVAVVFSRFDEFSRSMWGVEIPVQIVGTDRLKGLFDTEDNVIRGQVYGSIADGTARILHQPPVIHPGDHHSRAAIGHAVDWFQRTLEGGTDLAPDDQIWFWKELGTLMSLVGLVLLLLAMGGALLETPFFEELLAEAQPPRSATGIGWLVSAGIFILLPVLTLFPFKGLASEVGLSPSALFPQSITNQIITWTSLVGLISLILFVGWHLAVNRRGGTTLRDYGLNWHGHFFLRRFGKSLALALLIVATGHLADQLSGLVFHSDFRFWVFAVRPLSLVHLRMALSYAIPFTAFFLVLSTVLHGQLRLSGQSLFQELATNLVLLVSGFVGLLVIQYAPLLMGGTLAFPSEPLWTIIAIQFIPVMTLVAILNTVFFRRTGHIYVGAFTSAFLITWIVVASQATHLAISW